MIEAMKRWRDALAATRTMGRDEQGNYTRELKPKATLDAIAEMDAAIKAAGEPESFEQWNAKQHGDPEEIGFLQALRIAYCAGQDSSSRLYTHPAKRLTDGEIALLLDKLDDLLIAHDDYTNGLPTYKQAFVSEASKLIMDAMGGGEGMSQIYPNPIAHSPIQQGWQCPECLRVHSPSSMLLRDYFAAKALQGLTSIDDGPACVSRDPLEIEKERTEYALMIAKAAYRFADAMMKARERV